MFINPSKFDQQTRFYKLNIFKITEPQFTDHSRIIFYDNQIISLSKKNKKNMLLAALQQHKNM